MGLLIYLIINCFNDLFIDFLCLIFYKFIFIGVILDRNLLIRIVFMYEVLRIFSNLNIVYVSLNRYVKNNVYENIVIN